MEKYTIQQLIWYKSIFFGKQMLLSQLTAAVRISGDQVES